MVTYRLKQRMLFVVRENKVKEKGEEVTSVKTTENASPQILSSIKAMRMLTKYTYIHTHIYKPSFQNSGN